MSFKKSFERNFNAELFDDEATGSRASIKRKDMDMQEAEDSEFCDQKQVKDDLHPPRFSTLFEDQKTVPKPARVSKQFESYPQPKRRSGIFVPTAFVIIFAVLFLFMSTVVFAYTVIGLYNNAPRPVLNAMGVAPTPGGAYCNCDTAKQPSINIAPNFMIPQAQQSGSLTITETISAPPSIASPTGDKGAEIASEILSIMSTARTSTSTTSTSISTPTTTSNPTSEAGLIASQMLSIMSAVESTSSTSQTPSVVVVVTTPSASETTRTTLLTVNADGSTLSGGGLPTVTISTTVAAPHKAKRTPVLLSSTQPVISATHSRESAATALQKLSLEEALAM